MGRLKNLVAVFLADDLHRVVPTEQADLRNIGPMAIGFPERLATVRTAGGTLDLAPQELLLERRVGPDGFAFVA